METSYFNEVSPREFQVQPKVTRQTVRSTTSEMRVEYPKYLNEYKTVNAEKKIVTYYAPHVSEPQKTIRTVRMNVHHSSN